MDATIPLLLVCLAVFAIVMVLWHYSRSRQVLENWASENDFTIVSSEYRNFLKGPFFWTSSRGQTVYYVTVRTPDGQTRNGWVRCGGWFFGLLTDKAEVRWDE
jgi:hypothetical protein